MAANVALATQKILVSCVKAETRNPIVKIERSIMLYTIAVIMLILWVLGLVSSYTMGGFIHILLVIAIVMILVRVIR